MTQVTGTRAHPRSRRMVGPLATAAVALVGVAAIDVISPRDSGPVVCPWRALTGLDCPFCGATRATYALLHGDLVAALDHNALLVLIVLPLMLGGWALWLRSSWSGRQFPTIPTRAGQWVLGLVLTWWVVRLVVPWLGSSLNG